MFPLYTKTFGGKIWKNLHSVSPDNFLDKKFKMAYLEISRQKNNLIITSCKKILSETPIRPSRKKKHFLKRVSCGSEIFNWTI